MTSLFHEALPPCRQSRHHQCRAAPQVRRSEGGAVEAAFRYGKMVLACATYDGFLFPPMEAFLTHLKTKNFQNRTVGLIENGTWAPMAAKLMRAELEGMKNMTLCDNVVTIRSAVNADSEDRMDVLAAEIAAR